MMVNHELTDELFQQKPQNKIDRQVRSEEFESLGSSNNLDFGEISGLSSFERSEDNIIQPEIVEYR